MSDGAAPATQPTVHADLRRRIRVTQRLAVGAMVASVLFIGFNVYKIISLRKQVKDLGKIADRQQKLTDLEADYTKALALANARSAELPVFDQIHPKAKAVPLAGQKDPRGNPLYDFTVWLDAPTAVREQIAKVTYAFDHPTFVNKRQVATDPSNGFVVSYRGWGALRLVTITVEWRNGTTHSYYFDMVSALGW